MSRTIRIIGAIDETAFKDFCEKLSDMEKDQKRPILIELSSGGGSAYDALAFAGRIRAAPGPVIITAYGLVASAAVIILAAGKHRKMTRESWVMVHEDSGKLKGTVVDLERESTHMRRLEDQWCALLEEFTGFPAQSWSDMHKKTTYLSAQQCKDYGLVEEIV